MQVDSMRFIDRYVGVPLCYLLALINWVLKQFRGDASKLVTKNVLLIELSEMGSTILADPAMTYLKSQGCKLFFVIFVKNKKSLEILKTVNDENIFVIRAGDFWTLTKDTLSFFSWCRKNSIDSCIDLELFSRFTALLSALCGAKKKVGFFRYHNEGLYRGNFLTHKIQFNPYQHITKNFMAMARCLVENKVDEPNPKILITDDEVKIKKAKVLDLDIQRVRAKVQKRFPELDKHRIVLLNANSSDFLPQRRWALSSFAKLAKQILKSDSNVLILLTGAPAERVGLEPLVAMVEDYRCINFAGELEFLDLIPLYAQSHLMVTNDSGPGHFSSVTNMPTIVLFGPETPDLYGPKGNTISITANLACSPCVSAWNHRKTPCTNNVCLQSISTVEVFSAVNPLLQAKAHFH